MGCWWWRSNVTTHTPPLDAISSADSVQMAAATQAVCVTTQAKVKKSKSEEDEGEGGDTV
ncbi:hypothetical protein AGMMS50222_05110 [Endomicrobiia bacterium]|nr:hypothetical protein AGMMS49556_07320 [Endomicrobiia bacterium]GHT74984.1 hypothetical protein AGMMS50222_05110 [Endomicrobiia bacterium]